MGRSIGGAIVLVVLFVLMLPVLAGDKEDYEASLSASCNEFHNHSGFVPGSYDVGVFIESGYDDQVHYTNGQSINIPPPSGRNSWDTVLKCSLTDTTTSTSNPSTSTTTTQPSTTTTESTTTTSTTVQPTTTTIGESTTTTTIQPSTTSSSIAPTTTSQETTTSLSVTTTTVNTEPTTTLVDPSTTLTTTPQPDTTLTTPSTDPPKALPLTGGNLIPPLLVVALLLTTMGVLMVRSRDQRP